MGFKQKQDLWKLVIGMRYLRALQLAVQPRLPSRGEPAVGLNESGRRWRGASQAPSGAGHFRLDGLEDGLGFGIVRRLPVMPPRIR